MNGNNGYDDTDVLYLAFTGSDAVPGADGAAWAAKDPGAFEESISSLGRSLLERINDEDDGDAEDEPPIVKVGSDPSNRLGRCEGDCDKDRDCSSGLKCFQRTERFLAVPGCSGGAQDDSLFDYCVRNRDNFPVLSKVGTSPSVPLERCEGDCDTDSDCASSDLFCFARTEADVFVPGCRGGESDDSLFDYCIRRVDVAPGVAPTTPPVSSPTGPNPTPRPTTPPVSSPTRPNPTPRPTPSPVSNGDLPLRATYDFPLGRCEGTPVCHGTLVYSQL
eukprot:scaffold9366_cov167-Cylindrotheca_fusiformis.AAC.1